MSQLGEILLRAQLITRLSAAAGILVGTKNRDCCAAVLEAIEIVRAKPYSEAAKKEAAPVTSLELNVETVKGWTRDGRVVWSEQAPGAGWLRIVAYVNEVSEHADA